MNTKIKEIIMKDIPQNLKGINVDSNQIQEEAGVIIAFLEQTADIVSKPPYSKINDKNKETLKTVLSEVLDSLAKKEIAPKDIIDALRNDLDGYIKVMQDKQLTYQTELDYPHLHKKAEQKGKEILANNDVPVLLRDSANALKEQANGTMKSKFYKMAGDFFNNIGMSTIAKYCHNQDTMLRLDGIKRTINKDSIIDQGNKYIKSIYNPKVQKAKQQNL